MIKTDKTGEASRSLKEIKKAERLEKETKIKALCEAYAKEKFGENVVVTLSNANKGVWFLPILNEDEDEVEKLLIMKPINRHILSYATSKMESEGLYAFLESAMRECVLRGDIEILDDDEYFIPASQKFNAILEGKKAALVKR